MDDHKLKKQSSVITLGTWKATLKQVPVAKNIKVQDFFLNTFKQYLGQSQAPADHPCSRDLLGGLCDCAPSGFPCEQISSRTRCKRRASSPCERPAGGPSSSRYGRTVCRTARSQRDAPPCACACARWARREWGSSCHRTDRDAVWLRCGVKGVGVDGRGR